jgi:molybdopterin synthase catalytic subunit
MAKAIHIEVLEQPLDISRACAFVTDPSRGAIDMFIGTVRDHHDGKPVTGITYDVHRGLAAKVLDEICAEASATWAGTAYYVAHFHGSLDVGGISVVIAVGSPHRQEAFEACRYVIEELKKRAPVWKQEHYKDGKSAWLPGHSLVREAEAQTVCCGRCGGAHG